MIMIRANIIVASIAFVVCMLMVMLLGCNCEPCTNPSKHKFRIGDVVTNRLDENEKFIVSDTTRIDCLPAYVVEDEYFAENLVKESSLAD